MRKPFLLPLALLAGLVAGEWSIASAQCRRGRCAVVNRNVIVNKAVAVAIVPVVAQRVILLEQLFVAGYQANGYGAVVVPGASAATAPAAKEAPAKEPAKEAPKEKEEAKEDEKAKANDNAAIVTALEIVGKELKAIKEGQIAMTKRVEALEKAKVAPPPMPRTEK